MAAFRKFTRAETDAGNAACRAAALVAQVFDLDLAVAPAPVDGETLELLATVNQADCRLLLPLSLANIVAARFLALADDYTIPDALLPAVLEATLSDGLAAVERATGVGVMLRQVTRLAAPDWPDGILLLHIRSLGTQAIVGVSASLPLASLQLPSPSWISEAHLPLRLPIVLGEVPLPVTDLQSLVTGDVVLLATSMPGEGLRVYLPITARHALSASFDGDRLTFLDRGTLMSTNISEPGGAAQPAASSLPAVPVEEVNLKVVFDLGEIELSLPEVRALVPGQVIDLGRLPTQAVRVSVNGRRIGTGEIVEIEGRLGVRLLELAGRHEHPTA
jgi:type III secretion protein Q